MTPTPERDAVRLLDPLFQLRAGLFQPGMPESLEEPVQEDLGLLLLVPLDVRPDPRDKPRQPLRSLGFLFRPLPPTSDDETRL